MCATTTHYARSHVAPLNYGARNSGLLSPHPVRPGASAHPHLRKQPLQVLWNLHNNTAYTITLDLCNLNMSSPSLCFPLTCVYSYVPNKLAGLFESLSAVMAAVCEPTAVNVFLVVSGTRGEGPVEGVNTKVSNWSSARQVYLHSTRKFKVLYIRHKKVLTK